MNGKFEISPQRNEEEIKDTFHKGVAETPLK